ncbi:hypothetical protein CMO92_04005 [Candidatus Woesearchaeota archaeon]|nr:hypothetical protein [Candidatus Woesearchaeota archaeon]
MGEIDQLKEQLRDSFSRIKKEMSQKDLEIARLRTDVEMVKQNLIPKEEMKELIFEAITRALNKKEEAPLKEELLKRFEKNKKEIIKQKIIELIAEKQDISISELKEQMVMQKYCSKASFYRYLRELQEIGRIDFMEINKKKICLKKAEF